MLIDCPPNFNIVTKTAVVASDYLLIPTKPDYLSTLGIQEIRKHLGTLVEDYNQHVAASDTTEWSAIRPQILGVLFTMIQLLKGDQPIATQQDYIQDIANLGLPVFATRIRNNQGVFGGAPSGLPVVFRRFFSVTQRGAQAEFQRLTDELLERADA